MERENISYLPRNTDYQTSGANALAAEVQDKRPRLQLVQPIQQAQEQLYEVHRESFGEHITLLNKIRAFSIRALANAGYEVDGDKHDRADNLDLDSERLNYERCRTDKEREDFRDHLLRQLITAVWERVREKGEKIEFTVRIDENGELRSEFWDKEPLNVIYLRGYEAKQQLFADQGGSPEKERDWQELIGQEAVKLDLTSVDAKVGDKEYIISGTGLAPNSTNRDNFVDGYQLIEVPVMQNGREVTRPQQVLFSGYGGMTAFKEEPLKEKKILYVRYSSKLTYEDYKRIALSLDPHYFDGFTDEYGQEVMPIDAWFKGKPLILSNPEQYDSLDDSYTALFAPLHDTRQKESFYRQLPHYLDAIIHLRDVLTDPTGYFPVAGHEARHSLYVETDELRKKLAQQVKNSTQEGKESTASAEPVSVRQVLLFEKRELTEERRKQMFALASKNSTKKAETIDAGCGPSKGLKKKNATVNSLFANSNGALVVNTITRISARGEVLDDEDKEYCDDCPPPPSIFANDGSDGHYHCPEKDCKEFYVNEEGNASYTPKCKCGHEFECDPKVTSVEEYKDKKEKESKEKKEEKIAA